MIKREESARRLRELANANLPFDDGYDDWNRHHDARAASAWFGKAAAALHDLFRPRDAQVAKWQELNERTIKAPGILRQEKFIDEARGVLDAALHRVENGHVESFRDAIRIDTEYDLLDQAEQLCNEGYAVAGAVLAGGALETHLRTLCERHGIAIEGDGSISKYNNAVGQARKADIATVYDKTDGKSVEAWGGLRNDAAHDPLNFKKTADDVKGVIEGIRQFIQRTGK